MREILVFLLQQGTVVLILPNEFSRPAKSCIITRSVNYICIHTFCHSMYWNKERILSIYQHILFEYFILFYHWFEWVKFNWTQALYLIVRGCWAVAVWLDLWKLMTSKEKRLLFAFSLKSVQSDSVICEEGQDIVLLLLSLCLISKKKLRWFLISVVLGKWF